MTDKFAWLRAIYAESRFPNGEKAVMAHVAIFNVLTGNDTLCVRQSTLADQCGISRRTVNSAISRAKALGYLAVSRARAPGWGRHGADELRLALPESREESSRDSGESREKQTQKSCEESAHHSPSREKQTQKSCEAADAITSENNTPNSSLNSSLKENSSRGVGVPPPDTGTLPSADLVPARQADDPPGSEIRAEIVSRRTGIEGPPLACSRHPNGNSAEPCRECGRVQQALAERDRDRRPTKGEKWHAIAAQMKAEQARGSNPWDAVFGRSHQVIDGEVLGELLPAPDGLADQ